MSLLEELGWTATLEAQFEQYKEDDLVPGRISAEHRGHYDLLTAAGEVRAQISGRMRHVAVFRDELPAVGDWVAAQAGPENGSTTIHAILPRRTALLRKDPDGRKGGSSIITAQVLAANLDTVFLVSALNLDFNLRRIERTLTVIWESGAQPVLLLNKADLCPDVEEHVVAAESVAVGVPIHAISALTGDGIGPIEEYVDHGKTVALIGSSGVGKSTLINHLAGEQLMTVKTIREDDSRGRHTTTHRQLVRLARADSSSTHPACDRSLSGPVTRASSPPLPTSRRWPRAATSPIAGTMPNHAVPSRRRSSQGNSTPGVTGATGSFSESWRTRRASRTSGRARPRSRSGKRSRRRRGDGRRRGEVQR